MAASDEVPPAESKLEETKEGDEGELRCEKDDKDQTLENCEDSSNSDDKTLAHADELMEEGSKASKEGDYAEAVDCFSRAVEIRVAHHGELAPECASAYYKYGCALLYKAQEEADPLVSVPKKETPSPGNSASDGTIKSGENNGSSSAAVVSEAKQGGGTCNNDEHEEGDNDKIQENENEESEDDDEDLVEADEEESDLDLAWKMLDVARAIVEKQPGDTLEEVDILAALGEVSLEREDIETSLSDYRKALSILERLVEPDSRRIAELNFRICLALEVGSKAEDAVPYCQKAISVCKARLQRLKAEVDNSTSLATANIDASSINDTNQNDNQTSDGSHLDSSISEKIEEVETLSGLSSELERKLEDLQQAILNPQSVLSEVLKMVGSKSMGGEIGTSSTEGRASTSERLSSIQMGIISGGFDSPTSTAAAGGNVTHLGVVGRGVKRAIVNPTSAELSPKKHASDSSVGKDGSISEE